MNPIVIGVCGGTGSGKTTVVQVILERVGAERIAYIQHDSYYRDQSHLPLEERARVNYDHPDSLETELLVKHVRQLLAGQAVEVPVYDFTTHTRTRRTHRVEPRRVILVEGILIFAEPELRDLMDVKIYVDTRHPFHPPFAAGHRRAGTDDGIGDRAVSDYRAPDAPGVRRAQQALRRRDHP